MDLVEQNEVANAIEKFIVSKFQTKPFMCIVSFEESPGTGFAFKVGNMDQRSPLQAWKTIVNGLTKALDEVTEEFKAPEESFNNPMEPR